MEKCCEDLGNWFFQYLTQDNKKAYECCECDEVHFLVLDEGEFGILEQEEDIKDTEEFLNYEANKGVVK